MTKSELSKLLPIILRERDYIEIDGELTKLITSIEGYAYLVHVENESGTINWKSEKLPDCRTGYSRLWSRQDWLTTDNVRNATKRRAATEREAAIERSRVDAEKSEQIISHFHNTTKLPREMIIKMFIGDGNEERISAIYKGLVDSGVKLN